MGACAYIYAHWDKHGKQKHIDTEVCRILFASLLRFYNVFENILAMLDIFDQVNSWFKIKSPIISTSSFPITMSLENEVDLN